MLVVPTHPLLLSAFVLADSASPRGWAYRLSGGYVVPRASHRAVTGSACLGRERLMEQPVSSGHTFSCETEIQTTCRSHEDSLCNVQTVSRSIHFGSLHSRVVGHTPTLAHRCRFVMGGPASATLPISEWEPPLRGGRAGARSFHLLRALRQIARSRPCSYRRGTEGNGSGADQRRASRAVRVSTMATIMARSGLLTFVSSRARWLA